MDPTIILLVVALGAFIIFQVFQGRKRKRETEERQSKFVVGAEIMTNYGVYGYIRDIDEDTNVVLLETTPGTVLRIHRQTILKIADYAVVTDTTDETTDEDAVTTTDDSAPLEAPEFGERIEPTTPEASGPSLTKPAEPTKPADSTDK